jgi:hypothetical protein
MMSVATIAGIVICGTVHPIVPVYAHPYCGDGACMAQGVCYPPGALYPGDPAGNPTSNCCDSNGDGYWGACN